MLKWKIATNTRWNKFRLSFERELTVLWLLFILVNIISMAFKNHELNWVWPSVRASTNATLVPWGYKDVRSSRELNVLRGDHREHCDSTELRDKLHWLRARQRLTFNCAIVYKAINGLTSSYLQDFCVRVPVMLSPRGQSGLDAKILASASASISLSYYVIRHFSCKIV